MKQKHIETERLIIRPFIPEDLELIHRILDITFGDGSKTDDGQAIEERRSWLQWSILNQKWFPQMAQPPYGDRAVVLKATNKLIGSVGIVPQLDRYGQVAELAITPDNKFNTPEVGLFWVIDPDYQKKGYATEAVQGMIDFAFNELSLKRIIATTEYDNHASQKVMAKVGMTIAKNSLPEPPWLQIVGFLENPDI